MGRKQWTVQCADGWICPRPTTKRVAKHVARLADKAPGPYCQHQPHLVVRVEPPMSQWEEDR